MKMKEAEKMKKLSMQNKSEQIVSCSLFEDQRQTEQKMV